MLLLVILFVIWLHYETTRASRKDKEAANAFWKKESEANNTRRADLSTLPYISIPLKSLPMEETNDAVLSRFQSEIQALSKEKILNLNGISNTDLKLSYGAANLPSLSGFDQNFTNLVCTLDSWGQALYEQEQYPAARDVFEYAVSCKSDVKNTYVCLAEIYRKINEPEQISGLINAANSLPSMTRVLILQSLQKYSSV